MAPRTSLTRRRGGWGAGRPLRKQAGGRPRRGAGPSRVRGAECSHPCSQRPLAQWPGLTSAGAELVRHEGCGRRWLGLVPWQHVPASVP
eukprot:10938799-Alexandrium_andersonii.AAC.1